MNPDALGAVLREVLVPALGRTILHSLWQVALVTAFTALALGLLRRAAANLRYVVACGGLVLSLALTVTTFVVFDGSRQAQDSASLAASSTPASLSGDNGPADARPGGDNAARTREASGSALALDAAFPWLVGAWALGVLLLSFRLFGAWWAVIRLVRRRTMAPRAEWRQLCDRVIGRAGITRAVRVFESAAVAVPTVIGWMRPVLLLPVSAMSGLTLPQVEAILAHELAHVRRHDYLVNLFQSAIETLLFYHPAVWWLSARIRGEREHCCDDAAVAFTGDPIGYARALTALEARRLPALKLAAAANGGPLMRRIARLRHTTGRPTTQPAWLLPLFVVFFLVVALASATAVRAAYNAPRAGARCDRDETATLGQRIHSVTRRMTVVESLAWRLPLAVRREIVSLGFADASSVLADRRQICVHPAFSLWDQLLPVVTELEPAVDARSASLATVPTDGTAAAQDPAVAADLEAARRELERARATIRGEMDQVRTELQRNLPQGAECQVRAAQEAMRRALEQTRRQQAEIERQMHGAAHEAAREAAATDWRDAERALSQAHERVQRELERTQQVLQRQLRRQDFDRLEQQLQRRMQEMDRQMKRAAERMNRLSREMPRTPDLPDRAPLPDVPDLPSTPDFNGAPLPPERPPLPPNARQVAPPPPVPPALPVARVPEAPPAPPVARVPEAPPAPPTPVARVPGAPPAPPAAPPRATCVPRVPSAPAPVPPAPPAPPRPPRSPGL